MSLTLPAPSSWQPVIYTSSPMPRLSLLPACQRVPSVDFDLCDSNRLPSYHPLLSNFARGEVSQMEYDNRALGFNYLSIFPFLKLCQCSLFHANELRGKEGRRGEKEKGMERRTEEPRRGRFEVPRGAERRAQEEASRTGGPGLQGQRWLLWFLQGGQDTCMGTLRVLPSDI